MKNVDFESFPIGTKVQSYCKYRYYVPTACGIIVKHLGGGHAIIYTFDGEYRSTVGQYKIAEVEAL